MWRATNYRSYAELSQPLRSTGQCCLSKSSDDIAEKTLRRALSYWSSLSTRAFSTSQECSIRFASSRRVSTRMCSRQKHTQADCRRHTCTTFSSCRAEVCAVDLTVSDAQCNLRKPRGLTVAGHDEKRA